ATRRLPQLTITAPAAGSSAFDDQAVTFTATARDDRDGDLTGVIIWRSSVDGALGTGGSVTAASLHRGVHTITATVRNSTGLTGVATLHLTASDRPPAVTITAPQDGRLFPIHFAASFTATATDNVDGAATPPTTPTAADSAGQPRAASITVTVYAAPPVLTIVAPADGFSTSGSVTFSGTALDFKDGDRSNTIRWSSNVAGSLGTGRPSP